MGLTLAARTGEALMQLGHVQLRKNKPAQRQLLRRGTFRIGRLNVESRLLKPRRHGHFKELLAKGEEDRQH